MLKTLFKCTGVYLNAVYHFSSVSHYNLLANEQKAVSTKCCT